MKGNQVVTPIHIDTLYFEDKRKVIESVHLVKKNRRGKIKGGTYADGSKQKRYLKEEESVSLPTVSLEGIVCTLIIDAHKGQDVITFDVLGAYLHAEIPKDKCILIKIRGDFVDIMCQFDPEYKQHVMYENGRKFLNLLVLREIYGCIET